MRSGAVTRGDGFAALAGLPFRGFNAEDTFFATERTALPTVLRAPPFFAGVVAFLPGTVPEEDAFFEAFCPAPPRATAVVCFLALLWSDLGLEGFPDEFFPRFVFEPLDDLPALLLEPFSALAMKSPSFGPSSGLSSMQEKIREGNWVEGRERRPESGSTRNHRDPPRPDADRAREPPAPAHATSHRRGEMRDIAGTRKAARTRRFAGLPVKECLETGKSLPP